jgi:hypothetical protein
MRMSRSKALAVAIAAVFVLGTFGPASARDDWSIMREEVMPAPKKRTGKRGQKPPVVTPRAAEPKVETPKAEKPQTEKPRAEKPRPRPRGSGTLIMPPVPSPTAGGPTPQQLLKPPPGPYVPSQSPSFGDRTTGCIHSFPLAGGVGNNPSNQQMYIRQCAN